MEELNLAVKNEQFMREKIEEDRNQRPYECGGIAAAWAGNDEPGLKSWIQEIQAGLPDRSDRPDISMDDLAAINVLAQVERLKNHPVLVKYGQDTEVIGCLFHIETGELKRLTPEEKVETAIGVD